MKTTTLLFFLLSFSFSYAQKKDHYQGSVLYKASLNSFNNSKKIPKKYEKYKAMVIKTMKESKDLYYSLFFKQGKSLFSLDKRLQVDDNKSSINFTRVLGGRGIYYSENNKSLHQKESMGESFLISMPKIKWKITQEKKKIGRYMCYKATSEKKVENNMGTFTKKIVAWYTPQIPLNLGPKNYIGLPGLIIELQEGRLGFYATKIQLNTIINKVIKKPTKGKKITLSEYNKMTKKLFGKK